MSGEKRTGAPEAAQGAGGILPGGEIAEEQALRLSLTQKLVEIYDPTDGMRAAGVLVPAIVGDFARMLGAAKPGERVSEEYRTEDGAARVLLSAVKTKGGSKVTASVERRQHHRRSSA